MAKLLKPFKWLSDEFGLTSVYNTGLDAWLIIFARCSRMFAYGATALILALFFAALEFSDFYIGLFMSLTLLGDVVLSLVLTLIADRAGRRRVLFLGSLLMAVSGAVFAVFENYWILLFAAVVGVVSATGSDFGPFRAIEESTLSHVTTTKTRADVMTWYVTTASLGSAVGTEIAGRVVNFLQEREGWTIVKAYHTIFWLYVVGGSLNMIAILFLSNNCELEEESKPEASETLLEENAPRNRQDGDEDDSESDEAELPELSMAQAKHEQSVPKKGYFAAISRETRGVMYKLWFLLVIDSLADGMTGYSLTNYYLDTKFHLAKSTLGDITSISYFLSSCSTAFAGSLVRHLGLINTMVFTHLPSSAAVLLFPLPRGLPMTIFLFFLRTTLNNMDQAPRTVLIAAVVKSDERTAVMGVTSILRTLASVLGPSFTGLLAGDDRFWIAFVAAGALRIAYDLGLFLMFVHMDLHQHEEKGVDGDRQEEQVPMSDMRRVGDEEEPREVRS